VAAPTLPVWTDQPLCPLSVTTTAAMVGAEMPATEMRINPALEAAWQVMIREIEWFQTLDDDTLEQIADTAPLHAPEHVYATAVLNRRTSRGSTSL
jgi:hypothetical protein